MTKEQYNRWTAPLRRRPRAVAAMKGINRALTALCYGMYPLLLAWLFVQEDGRFWRCLAVPAISFAAVSVFRKLYNAPRPYELGYDSLLKKKRTGCSFPSRHVFSAAMIAVTYWYALPAFAPAMLAVTGLLAVIRVAGGVHFVRDVAAGAAFAAAAGVLGYCLVP